MAKEREIKEEHIFKVDGTFRSVYKAQSWCIDNGYSYGSMDARRGPIAIIKGEYNLPQKWHNFKSEHKKAIDGIITSNDWREGEVKVIIYK